MQAFELPSGTYVTITKTTPRKEHHGDDLVQAISLRLSWTTTNDSLAKLHPNLKAALYWKQPGEEAQERIGGVPEITPNLRVPTMATPVTVEASFSGYTLTIDHGIDESTALELYGCSLEKFKVDPKEGGSVTISWSVSSNKSVTPELVGALCGLEGDEVTLQMVAPVVQEAIDGTVAAFNNDHPGQGSLLDDDAPAMDATDAFIRSGTDEGLGADGDDDGMPPGTHDEGERQERREEAVAASRARMSKLAPQAAEGL
ncbi:MAG: hypothetical protein RLZZ182_1828 [Pseudomonadota bacterium]|jgi:hypothetical protein